MKKKIEGELISIAHRLLQLKKPTDTIKLHEEVKKLYEQLTLLKFYEANTVLVNEEFSESVFEEKVEKIVVGVIEVDVDEEEVLTEMASKEHIAQIEEELFENNEISHEVFPDAAIEEAVVVAEIVSPNVALQNEELVTVPTPEPIVNVVDSEIIGTKVSKQISMDDFFVHNYQDTLFVKKEEVVLEEIITEPVVSEIIPEVVPVNSAVEVVTSATDKTSQSKAIVLGLNDKIAFEKNLFASNADDLQRVLSQLNTFTNWDDAKSFVLDFVKPDYNNWENKEEFEVRFLEIVENKFK